MELSLRYMRVLLEFLEDSDQSLEVVSDLTIVSSNHWDFTYRDLDSEVYRCSIKERGSLKGPVIIFDSELYDLSIIIRD